MADRSSNVVHIAGHPYKPETDTSAEASTLLDGCRDRLVQGVATVFAQHLGEANEDLLNLADRATSIEQQRHFFSAMEFLANYGHQLLQQFRVTFVEDFDTGIAKLRGEQPSINPHSGFNIELSLVDTNDFERDLAVSKLTARATCNCSQQLTALERRLLALLRIQRITQDDNPLHPRALFNSMLNTLTSLDVEEQVALILLQEFEHQTSTELPSLYADLNRFLADAGILPKIPLSTPQRPARGEPDANGGRSAQSGSARQESTAGNDGYASQQNPELQNRGEDIFAQLATALQNLAARNTVLAPGVTHMPSIPMPPQTAVSNQQAPQLLSILNDLQQGQHEFQPMAPGMAPIQIDPAQLNVLQQIRTIPMASASQPSDSMTIDIVAMLFEAMFSDEDLAPTMRAELAKLQIPVLKVALIDKTFFSDRHHPARQLLDTIASSGIGRSEKDEPRLIEKIGSIIDTIIEDFDSDIDIFEKQCGALKAFLEEEEERSRILPDNVLVELERRDREEVAPIRVGSEITARIQNDRMPQLIADFLDISWRQVLLEVFVRAGEEHQEWTDTLALMDDLIWSVDPKHTIPERDRLVKLLPELLKKLRQNLARIDKEGSWDEFFGQLIHLHMAALHSEINPQAAPHEADSSSEHEDTGAAGSAQEASRTGQEHEDSSSASGTALAVHQPASFAEPSESSDMGLEWDSHEKSPVIEESHESPVEAGHPDTDEDEDDHYLRVAQALDVGAWVEFQNVRGERKTLRLNWVSEYRGVYLFTNRQGDNAVTLAASSLATHLRNGTARLLSPDPLTARAVSQVIENASRQMSSPED